MPTPGLSTMKSLLGAIDACPTSLPSLAASARIESLMRASHSPVPAGLGRWRKSFPLRKSAIARTTARRAIAPYLRNASLPAKMTWKSESECLRSILNSSGGLPGSARRIWRR